MVTGYPLHLERSDSKRTKDPMQIFTELLGKKTRLDYIYGYVNETSEGIPVVIPRKNYRSSIWFPEKNLVRAYGSDSIYPEEGKIPNINMEVPPAEEGIQLKKLYCKKYLTSNRHHKSGDPFFRGIYSFPNKVELSIDSYISYGKERHEVHDLKWSNQEGDQKIRSFILTKSPGHEEVLKVIVETPDGNSILVYDGKNAASTKEIDEVYRREPILGFSGDDVGKKLKSLPEEVCIQSLEFIIKEVLDATASKEEPHSIIDYLEIQRNE